MAKSKIKGRNLNVRCHFEPNRLASACLHVAYEELLNGGHRAAGPRIEPSSADQLKKGV